jgi:putative flippase GtrA
VGSIQPEAIPLQAMQLVKFLLVGVANMAVGLSCIYVAMYAFGLDYIRANALGYSIGLLLSFVLNKAWTFEHEGMWGTSLARWLAVAAFAYGCNLATVIAAHRYLGVDAAIAQLAGNVIYTATSFVGGRHFAFAGARANG